MVAHTHGAHGSTVSSIVQWENTWVEHREIFETQSGKHKNRVSRIDNEESMFEVQAYIKTQEDSP